MRKYQPKDVVDWKNYIKLVAQSQIPESFKPIDGPIVISARFIFQPLKSFSKKKISLIESGWIFSKTTKPDLTDNLFKGLIDALSGVIWERDQQICMTRFCEKVYGSPPRIELHVEEMDECRQGNLPYPFEEEDMVEYCL